MKATSPTARQERGPYRGSGGDLRVFAPLFIDDRMAGFEKDLRICLTPVPAIHRRGETHAYFPALAACCGAIEYLATLTIGRARPIRDGLVRRDIESFAQDYMRQPDYDAEAVFGTCSEMAPLITESRAACGLTDMRSTKAGG
jgi:hypothetical protein